MIIQGVQVGEIYIVLFIQYKKKNPDFNPIKLYSSWRYRGFPEEVIPTTYKL